MSSSRPPTGPVVVLVGAGSASFGLATLEDVYLDERLPGFLEGGG